MPGPSESAGRLLGEDDNRSAVGALVMNRFWPGDHPAVPVPNGLGTRNPAGFEPAPDSVSAKDATTSPEAIPSSQRLFCSSVPKPTST